MLQKLPVLQQLRSRPGAQEWYESRPHMGIPKKELAFSLRLTAGSLRGPGKLALPPLVCARKDEKDPVAIIHVGTVLCGHGGVVHGAARNVVG